MAQGPIIIGYDGSPASVRAVEEAGRLLVTRQALIVTVWEEGKGFASVAQPTAVAPVPIDYSLAMEVEEQLHDNAHQAAALGAGQGRAVGLEVESLVVTERDSVGSVLVRLCTERDAQVLVLGSHGRGGISEALFGSTVRDSIKRAPCPVLVVRATDAD